MGEVEWKVSNLPINYRKAVACMESRVSAIRNNEASELVWLLEHPPLYTAGTSAHPSELLDGSIFPVYDSGRGGKYTYHGPGQRIAYVMMDLRERGRDVRGFVNQLEEWLIYTLAQFNIVGERRKGRIGIWIDQGDGREAKIAAAGVRVRHWITFHGISFNIEPDLSHYQGIVPCGINQHSVTSLADLGLSYTTDEVDLALKKTFAKVFKQ